MVQVPSNGTATIGTDNSITYTPNGIFIGTDTIVYSVTDIDGDLATATVTINISCTTCAAVNLKYSWNPNPASDAIIGYRVYTGPTLATATTEIANPVVGSSGFNAAAPSVSFDAWNDLGLNKGDTVCFQLKAYNAVGTSGYSTGICDVIPN
ncbi:MAG TPA: hypothetical protein ENI97_08335 [Gammaproteobacteria bacterium]|nr:hypothetical protein [Gammaproteobacteria bacterium]